MAQVREPWKVYHNPGQASRLFPQTGALLFIPPDGYAAILASQVSMIEPEDCSFIFISTR
jgi:hypothetical protein